MKKKTNKKYPCEDAYINNPVASNNEATGYVTNIPDNDTEAMSYAELYDVPVTDCHGGEAVPPAR